MASLSSLKGASSFLSTRSNWKYDNEKFSVAWRSAIPHSQTEKNVCSWYWDVLVDNKVRNWAQIVINIERTQTFNTQRAYLVKMTAIDMPVDTKQATKDSSHSFPKGARERYTYWGWKSVNTMKKDFQDTYLSCLGIQPRHPKYSAPSSLACQHTPEREVS